MEENMNRDLESETGNVLKLKDMPYDKIIIKDTVLLHAKALELKYLLSLDADRLLAGFQETAGLKAKSKRYSGWEITEIQGHTLGHYLTALSQAYAGSKDKIILERIQYLVSELGRCQTDEGYLFAWKEEIFDRVENLQPAWVPWYTMHKILSGLIAVYQYTALQEAYLVMNQLGKWTYERCIKWTSKLQTTVLAVEYGGMNDCLYELFQVTKDEKYIKAAHQFDELTLFEPLYKGIDVLNGLHANTTIPKVIGALKRYITLGESEFYYFRVAKNFWDMVIYHHTYITGGNSEWERFGEANILDEERTSCNCETCNTYNMLKLTKILFQITKEKKYADYYEQAFINAILSSQNPMDGMTTYFQPMATGFFKVYSTPYHSFWCCTGSGMESFTKLSDGTCFYDQDTLYINRFYDMDLTWEEQEFQLEIKADMLKTEKVQINISSRKEESLYTIAVRLPQWINDCESIFVNNKSMQYSKIDGYAYLTRKWRNGDKVTLLFPMKLAVHSLPDNPNVVAFTFGPFVLSAGLGTQMLNTTYTGVDVLIPTKEITVCDYISIQDLDIEEWKNHIDENLVKINGKIEFVLTNSNNEIPLVFTPHFARSKERYGIYFKIYKKDSVELQLQRDDINKKLDLQKVQVDRISIGNDQYELSHMIKGVKTDTAIEYGHKCRFVKENGWFSYQLKIELGTLLLCVTYCSEDAGNELDIYINDSFFIHEKITKDEMNQFYTKEYYLADDLSKNGINMVIVKFQNSNPQDTCRIYDDLYIRRQ
jgi:hypothetical protein